MAFLKISQKSQENTSARVSFLIVFFWKRNTDAGVFLWFLRNFLEHFFDRKPSDDCLRYDPTKPVQLAYDAFLSGSAAVLQHIIPETKGQSLGSTSRTIAHFRYHQ